MLLHAFTQFLKQNWGISSKSVGLGVKKSSWSDVVLFLNVDAIITWWSWWPKTTVRKPFVLSDIYSFWLGPWLVTLHLSFDLSSNLKSYAQTVDDQAQDIVLFWHCLIQLIYAISLLFIVVCCPLVLVFQKHIMLISCLINFIRKKYLKEVYLRIETIHFLAVHCWLCFHPSKVHY